MKSRPTTESAASDAAEPIFTADTILPSGKRVELVRSTARQALLLMVWSAKDPYIGEETYSGDQRYRPIQLDPSILQAIYFPTGVAEFGTVVQLATEIGDQLCLWLGLDLSTGRALAVWILSTWVFDTLPAPPTLAIVGNFGRAMQVFRVLQHLVRRGLGLADMTRADLRALPMILHPTLLINREDLPAKMRALLAASNYSGFHIAGRGPKLMQVSGSRAIYAGTHSSSERWNENTLTVYLTAPDSAVDLPTEEQLQATAARLQPKLLMYRMRDSYSVQLSLGSVAATEPGGTELSYNLLACALNEKELIEGVRPQLDSHEEEGRALRSRDPDCVIFEILYACLHQGGTITVSDLTEKLNSLLRSRGEFLVYRCEEVGWRLRALGIPRARGQQNREIRFSRDISRLLHQGARGLGLVLPKHEGCLECAGPQVVDQQ